MSGIPGRPIIQTPPVSPGHLPTLDKHLNHPPEQIGVAQTPYRGDFGPSVRLFKRDFSVKVCAPRNTDTFIAKLLRDRHANQVSFYFRLNDPKWYGSVSVRLVRGDRENALLKSNTSNAGENEFTLMGTLGGIIEIPFEWREFQSCDVLAKVIDECSPQRPTIIGTMQQYGYISPSEPTPGQQAQAFRAGAQAIRR